MSDGKDRLWDSFWQTAPRHGCTAGFPPPVAEAIARRWQHGFATRRDRSLLDVATGGGAVVDHALAAGIPRAQITAIDRTAAPGKIDGVTMLGGIDAAALPFADDSFDMVSSQFGIEYAGWHAAMAEAARVARRSIFVLAHHRDSAVVRHGGEQAMQALAMAEDGALAGAVHASVASGDAAEAERLIDRLRQGAENDTLLDQMAEAAQVIVAMRSTHEPATIAAMIDHLGAELRRHAGRMRAMTDAAIDDDDLNDATRLLEDAGFAIAVDRATSQGGELVAMWITAERPTHTS